VTQPSNINSTNQSSSNK